MDTGPKVTINGRAEIPPGVIGLLSEKAFIVPKSALQDLLKTIRFPTESSELVTALKSSVAADKNLRSNLEDHEVKTVLPLRRPQYLILKADCSLLGRRSQR